MRSSSGLGAVLAASLVGLSMGFLNRGGGALRKLPVCAARRLGALRMSTTDDSKVGAGSVLGSYSIRTAQCSWFLNE